MLICTGSTFCHVSNCQHRLYNKNLEELGNVGYFGKISLRWKGKEASCNLISLSFPMEFPCRKKSLKYLETFDRVQVAPGPNQRSR